MNNDPDESAETRKLLEQARSGDPGAFDRLFARYRPYLRRVIDLRLDAKLRTRVDASDVVQEAQMEATRRLADYLEHLPVPFRLWLRQLAHERLLMLRRRHLRTARRTVTREVTLPEDSTVQLAQQLFAGGSTPSQHLAKRELVQRIQQAVAQLPDTYREILLMRSFEKLSYEEIARIAQIEPATARKRHGRALVRLSKIVRDGGLTESQL